VDIAYCCSVLLDGHTGLSLVRCRATPYGRFDVSLRSSTFSFYPICKHDMGVNESVGTKMVDRLPGTSNSAIVLVQRACNPSMFLSVLSLPAWVHPCMTWGEDKIFSCQSGKMLNCLCEGLPRVYSTIWCLCYKTNELKKRKQKRKALGRLHRLKKRGSLMAGEGVERGSAGVSRSTRRDVTWPNHSRTCDCVTCLVPNWEGQPCT
jgi:hypothetical protein